MRKDNSIKFASYQSKLQKSNALTERYKSIAKMAVDKYISSKAVMLGVDVEQITSKLNENYSFEDIDRVCESLKSLHFDLDALPFDTINRGTKTVKVRVKGSENEPIRKEVESGSSSLDDECDDQLWGIARL